MSKQAMLYVVLGQHVGVADSFIQSVWFDYDKAQARLRALRGVKNVKYMAVAMLSSDEFNREAK
jgi:hypothetical protein